MHGLSTRVEGPHTHALPTMLDRLSLIACAGYHTGTNPRWYVAGFLYGYLPSNGEPLPNIQGVPERAAFTDGLCGAGLLNAARQLEEPSQ